MHIVLITFLSSLNEFIKLSADLISYSFGLLAYYSPIVIMELVTAHNWLALSTLGKVEVGTILAIPALIIALYIPLAISVFENSNKTYSWDNIVVLKYVVRAKMLLIALLISIFVSVLWTYPILRIIVLPALIYSQLELIRGLIRTYLWASTLESGISRTGEFRINTREEYIKGLNDNEKPVVWAMTWASRKESKDKSAIDDRQLIEMFIDSVDDSKDNEGKASMLREYVGNLIDADIRDPHIQKLLVQKSLSWSNYFHYDPAEDYEDWVLSIFNYEAQELYKKVMYMSLESEFATSAHTFYKETESALKGESDEIQASFVNEFSVSFFANLEKYGKSNRQIWEEFPTSWKVKNIKANRVEAIWFSSYLNWIQDRRLLVDPDSFKYDSLHEEVIRKVFVNVDPITWGILISFSMSPYGLIVGESDEYSRLYNYLNQRRTFGHIGRLRTFGGDFKSDSHVDFEMAGRNAAILLIDQANLLAHVKDDDQYKKLECAAEKIRKAFQDDIEMQNRLDELMALIQLVCKA